MTQRSHTQDLLLDTAATDHFLGEIADTLEKLDIIAHLHRASFGPHTTIAIAEALRLPSLEVAEALRSLVHAGVVATINDDGAGWWLDPYSGWFEIIASVAKRYERDRMELLRRIARLALLRMRAIAAGEPVNTPVFRSKIER